MNANHSRGCPGSWGGECKYWCHAKQGSKWLTPWPDKITVLQIQNYEERWGAWPPTCDRCGRKVLDRSPTVKFCFACLAEKPNSKGILTSSTTGSSGVDCTGKVKTK